MRMRTTLENYRHLHHHHHHHHHVVLPYVGILIGGLVRRVFAQNTNSTKSWMVVDHYSFDQPVNTTSLENLYNEWNCTYFKCVQNTNTTAEGRFNNETILNSTDILDYINGNDDVDGESRRVLFDLILMTTLSILLGLMILVTVIGNVFVIAAILIERNLQNVANYLIVSLAVADLMVACLVMPLGAVYVISNNWIMGPELCDMWTSIDVLCCTASILHLVAIALDRYWAVTNVDYIHTRNSRRIGIMIIVVWTMALVVSLAPQIPQFKDPDYLYRIEIKKQCLVSQDVKYQIFATSSTFYVPLFVICILYWKIFQTARKRIRRRRDVPKPLPLTNLETSTATESGPKRGFLLTTTKRALLKFKRSNSKKSSTGEVLVHLDNAKRTIRHHDEDEDEDDEETTTAFTIEHHQQMNGSDTVGVIVAAGTAAVVATTSTVQDGAETAAPPPVATVMRTHKEKKESLEAKRERKAAKTLAIITGAFVMCWLPFFVLALLMPLCASCTISDYVMSFALWLGYFNSTLNPVIYTIFSPEFRQAFTRILCGRSGYRNGGGVARDFRLGKYRR